MILLRAKGYINGSLIPFLFDSGSSHNLVSDHLVHIWGSNPPLSDHTYKVHLADARVQCINGMIHSFEIYIDTYIEQVDFHVMNLCTTDVTVGYPWFFNKTLLYLLIGFTIQ